MTCSSRSASPMTITGELGASRLSCRRRSRLLRPASATRFRASAARSTGDSLSAILPDVTRATSRRSSTSRVSVSICRSMMASGFASRGTLGASRSTSLEAFRNAPSGLRSSWPRSARNWSRCLTSRSRCSSAARAAYWRLRARIAARAALSIVSGWIGFSSAVTLPRPANASSAVRFSEFDALRGMKMISGKSDQGGWRRSVPASRAMIAGVSASWAISAPPAPLLDRGDQLVGAGAGGGAHARLAPAPATRGPRHGPRARAPASWCSRAEPSDIAAPRAPRDERARGALVRRNPGENAAELRQRLTRRDPLGARGAARGSRSRVCRSVS